jgi:hypothetical protein
LNVLIIPDKYPGENWLAWERRVSRIIHFPLLLKRIDLPNHKEIRRIQ